jgi:uncharacterized repeat protein (TIGR03803 family)
MKGYWLTTANIALTLCAATAATGTTYTYQGNHFTSAQSPYTTSDYITGYFVTATALTGGLDAVEITSDVSTFWFTDGVNTLTPSNSNPSETRFVVSTDTRGNISSWDVTLITNVAVPNDDAIFTCSGIVSYFNSCPNFPEDNSYEENGQISAYNESDQGLWSTFNSLLSFDGVNGGFPVAPLTQGAGGDLYGTTSSGGAIGPGTVFKITPSGTLTTLHTFCSQAGCADGEEPESALIPSGNLDLYGTTHSGGSKGRDGTVFRITPTGALTTLQIFDGADGAYPVYGGLIQSSNGDLYGTTFGGGTAACPAFSSGCGTVFKISPSGTLTTLYNFCSVSGCADGAFPDAGLVLAANGDLYGTTTYGGNNNCGALVSLGGGCGTIFKITPSGAFTPLYAFCALPGCADGAFPYQGLVQAANGDLYGTTFEGGTSYGTIFKITPSGALTTLYDFCSQPGCADGENPIAPLIEGSDGNLYGTTYDLGVGQGTIFRITPGGTLTTLYSFCQGGGTCVDGDTSYGLVQDTDGTFYGTTEYGGASGSNDAGTIFSLSVGLGPFVKTLPASAKPGASVDILGNDLTGATSVSFNGAEASFTVVSGSLITTTVPAGATSGNVEVITPSGMLSSHPPFRVLP